MQLTVEAWTSKVAQLTPEQAQAIAEVGLATVQIDQPPDTWKLDAGSRVGVLDHGDWGLRVVPRLAVPKVMFLLGYATDPRGWRKSIAMFGRERDFFSAIASGFAHHAYRALEPAPLRGYMTVEEQSPALRGRLRVADQMARTMPLPLDITYDDHTIDIPENRMLRGAAELLLRVRRVPEPARKRLLRIRATLEDVEPASGPTEAPEITRLNERYAPALHLAELILASASITTERGEITSVAFVFDMNKVFEDFLSTALTDAMARYGGAVQLQYSRRYLDQERALRLKPDITWWKRGRVRAIIDAKYKSLVDFRFPNADAYQMLAYCMAFGLPQGFLVYARDAEQRSRLHHIEAAGTEIKVRAVDVERQPDDVLGQVDELAAEIAFGARIAAAA
jgi:5-methylcytosine-specific restriction enzyme subunit McrC